MKCALLVSHHPFEVWNDGLFLVLLLLMKHEIPSFYHLTLHSKKYSCCLTNNKTLTPPSQPTCLEDFYIVISLPHSWIIYDCCRLTTKVLFWGGGKKWESRQSVLYMPLLSTPYLWLTIGYPLFNILWLPLVRLISYSFAGNSRMHTSVTSRNNSEGLGPSTAARMDLWISWKVLMFLVSHLLLTNLLCSFFRQKIKCYCLLWNSAKKIVLPKN